VGSEALVQSPEKLGTTDGSKMLNVLSLVVGWLAPPFVGSYELAGSSTLMLDLSTPSISTNNVWPFDLEQVGPGDFQPEGVGPGVSQRFASPPETLVVIPGLNGLAVKLAAPVLFAVMSVILTICGVHWTFEFKEVEVVA
jgi:hypothetical protein